MELYNNSQLSHGAVHNRLLHTKFHGATCMQCMLKQLASFHRAILHNSLLHGAVHYNRLLHGAMHYNRLLH